MVEIKRLTINVVKAHRKFLEVIRKLKLSSHRDSLKESVEFSERFNYVRRPVGWGETE